MSTAHTPTSAPRWEAGRFYWAILEPSAGAVWSTAGQLPTALIPDIAEQIPESSEALHAVCLPDPAGRLIVCAASREELSSLCPDAISLTPVNLPESLGVADIDPHRFNLLVGDFEPAVFRRARARSRAIAAAAVLVAAALVTVGSARRAAHDHRELSAAEQASRTMLAANGMPGDAEAELRAELERLRRAASVDLDKARPPDAAASLQAILHGWPTGLAARPQSISVGPDGAAIAVLVQGDAAEFLTAFKPPDSWRVDSPSLVNVGPDTRVNLHLHPQPSGVRP